MITWVDFKLGLEMLLLQPFLRWYSDVYRLMDAHEQLRWYLERWTQMHQTTDCELFIARLPVQHDIRKHVARAYKISPAYKETAFMNRELMPHVYTLVGTYLEQLAHSVYLPERNALYGIGHLLSTVTVDSLDNVIIYVPADLARKLHFWQVALVWLDDVTIVRMCSEHDAVPLRLKPINQI